MSIWNWLFRKLMKEPTEKKAENTQSESVSNAQEPILEPEKTALDPEETPKPEEQPVAEFIAEEVSALTEAELLDGYKKAMKLKKDGKFLAAEKLLILSCEPPSVYKSHYKELFKIWRQYNREDLKIKKYRKVLNRVLKMHKLDNEMIAEMLRFWGEKKDRDLSDDYFDADRNLLVSDARALKVAAEALQENKNVEFAESLIAGFSKK